MSLSTLIKLEIDKRFSLRCSQEIKNNTDFIYATNQSLQDLSIAIDSLSSRVNSRFNLIENRQGLIERNFEVINASVENHRALVNGIINDLKDHQNKTLKSFSDSLDSFSAIKADSEYVADGFEDLKSLHKDLETNLEKVVGIINSLRSEMQGKLADCSDKLRKELTPVIPEVDPLKVYINSVIDILKVDFASLKQEIALLTKARAYSDKQFEFVVNQLNRIKKDIS